MLNKKIIMLAIILVSLLAISAVSAAENVTYDVVNVDETTNVVEECTNEITKETSYLDDKVNEEQLIYSTENGNDLSSNVDDDLTVSANYKFVENRDIIANCSDNIVYHVRLVSINDENELPDSIQFIFNNKYEIGWIDNDGYASIQLGKLEPGNYTIKASDGDTFVTNNIIVNNLQSPPYAENTQFNVSFVEYNKIKIEIFNSNDEFNGYIKFYLDTTLVEYGECYGISEEWIRYVNSSEVYITIPDYIDYDVSYEYGIVFPMSNNANIINGHVNRGNKIATAIEIPMHSTIDSDAVTNIYVNPNNNEMIGAILKTSDGRIIKNANVYISIDGFVEEFITDNNGYFGFSSSELIDVESSYLRLIFNGDENYSPCSKTIRFFLGDNNFKKEDFDLMFLNLIPATGYDDFIIKVTCPEDATGYIIVEKGDECYTKSITRNNGVVYFYPNDLNINFNGKSKTYHFVVSYKNDEYDPVTLKNDYLYLTWDFMPVLNENVVIDYNERIMELYYPTGVEGNIIVIIDENQYYNEEITESGIQKSIYLSDLKNQLDCGNHEIRVRYVGDNYESNIIEDTINITNYQNYIFVDINQNDDTFIANFTSTYSNLTGYLNIYIDDKLEFTNFINYKDYVDGKYNLKVYTSDLNNVISQGTHEIKLTFNDNLLTEQQINISNLIYAFLNDDVVPNDENGNPHILHVISYNSNLIGDLEVYVNGIIEFSKEIKSHDYIDGIYELTIYQNDLKNKLNHGNHNISILFNNKIIKKGLIYVNCPVYFSIPNYNIDGHCFEFGENIDLRIFVPEDAKGNLTVLFNNEVFNIVYNKGVGYLTIRTSNLTLGLHEIVAKFEGDSFYDNCIITDKILISPKITYYDKISVSENPFIKFNAPESFNGILTIYNTTLDENNDYIKSDIIASVDIIKGNAVISLNSLNEGKYVFYLEYGNLSDWVVFDVRENNPNFKVTVEPSSLEVGNNVNVKFTSPVSSGWITFYIDDEPFKAVNLNGANHISEVISNLNIGPHKIWITFDYSEYDSTLFYSNTFYVNVNEKVIIPSLVLSQAVSTVYNGGKYIVATLKDNHGSVISGVKMSITLNGKVYTLTTDKNGQVKVSTNGLAPEIYTATITFAGNTNYAKSTGSAKVTVTKATPKITAKAKTFKRTVKTKKYSITLKTNQNKVMKSTKVYIKVNKKTYTAKTNSKGVATFKITKLTKKGRYTAVVTYKGNAYYNKLTKKVKITVK